MSYKATILTDTPAGFWRLSDAVGATVATDDSGNVRPGVYTGSPTLGALSPLTRDVATAMTLDGVDDLMDVPDNAAFDGVGDFSIELWFKTGTLVDANAKLFWKRLGGNGYALHITTATGLLTFECETGAVNNQLNTTVTNWADGQWHHVVATRSGANGSIYVDGALVAGPTAMTSNSLANTAVLRIGSNDTVTRRFVGSLFGAAYYGAALTLAQVTAHYTARLLYDYQTMLASHAAALVVLAELQPMEPLRVWNAAGGGLTNTYYTFYSTQIATTIVPGGIYRRLDTVKQDATALTSRASAALVNSNLGSYFHDVAAGRIYVSTTSGLTPEGYSLVGAWFTLFFSTTSISFTDQPGYLPLVTGTLPTLSAEKPDVVFGATITTTGEVSLLNGDGLFDRVCRAYVWRNKKATFKLGGVGLAYSDFATCGAMRINRIDVNDDLATIQLEAVGSILNRSIPTRTWGDGSFVGTVSEPTALSLVQPWLFGVIENCKLTLGDKDTSFGKYWTIDPVAFPVGVTITAVTAVDRVTKNTIPLSLFTDVTVSAFGFTVTVTNATYTSDTYDIHADLSINAGSTPIACGTFARNLLILCGEDTANIDAAAFTAADVANPAPVALYLDEPLQAADVMRKLEQSCRGQVFVGTDGRWTMRLFDPSLPADAILSDADFVAWNPTADLVAVLNELRVQYHDDDYLGASEVSASDDAVLYGSETSDSHRVPTYLRTSEDATVLAQHLRFLSSAPPALIGFEERGLTLMGADVGDLIAVTRARGPVARNGKLDGQVFELVGVQKQLGPDAPIVRGVLSDLGGRADQIFRLAPLASTMTWSTATDAQRAQYGFLGDANRYVDNADVLTKDGKALW